MTRPKGRKAWAVWKAPLLGARARMERARGEVAPIQRAAAGISADAGFFDCSPVPLAVNWRMNSSSGFEDAAFSWMLIPAFSLRMRLSNVSRTLPLPCALPGLAPAPLLMKRRPGRAAGLVKRFPRRQSTVTTAKQTAVSERALVCEIFLLPKTAESA